MTTTLLITSRNTHEIFWPETNRSLYMLFNDIVKINHLVNTFKMIFNSYIRNVPGNACKVIFSFQSTMYKKHRGIFQSKIIIFENYMWLLFYNR